MPARVSLYGFLHGFSIYGFKRVECGCARACAPARGAARGHGRGAAAGARADGARAVPSQEVTRG